MRFGVLGPLEVVDGDRLLDLGAPKQRAVLAMLLIDANRVVRVDRLIDSLWGDDVPARAMGSLQAYISNLRRVLEPDREPRQPSGRIVTRGNGYAAVVASDELDATVFESAAAEGHDLLTRGRYQAAYECLGAALALWRGGALSDFGFEPFVIAEQSRLEQLRLLALEDRFEAALALGRHAEVVPGLEALVVEQPVRERLWELLLLALYRSGRQAEALRAYGEVRKQLVESLGIIPGARLVELEGLILAQAAELDWTPPRDDRVGAQPEAQVTATPSAQPAQRDSRLVGRDDELAQLAAELARAATGRARVALVDGEAGIGKTRLLEELATRAASDGYAVAFGACDEGSGAPAFWPWIQVVRSLLDRGERDGVAAALGRGSKAVARLVPERSVDAGDGAPALLDPDRARYELFEGVGALLAAVAGRAPLVVVLDDLQWADASSLQLLAFITRQMKALPLFVVCSYRGDEVDDGHPLADTIATLARHDALRLHLTGLRHDEIGELVAATARTDPTPDVVAMIEQRTEGNPFFVTELTRLLDSEGSLAGSDGNGSRVVPVAVRDVIRRRLARLPPTTTALLQLGAVAGRDFDVRVLEVAADLDSEQTLKAVEAASMTGLLVEDLDRVGRYRFSHALVQDAISVDISSLRRARMHGRLGRAIETVPPGPDEGARIFELADHYFHAAGGGGTADVEAAFEYAMRAAEVASSRLAYEQEREQLERALQLVASMPIGPSTYERELRAQVRLSLHLNMMDGYAAPGIGPACARAQELCRLAGDRSQLLPTLWLLSAFRNVRGEHRAAEELGEQLLESASGLDRAYSAVGHGALGLARGNLGQLARAVEHFEQALSLCDPSLDERLMAVLNHHPVVLYSSDLAHVRWLRGEPLVARELCDRSVALARRTGHPYGLTHALTFDAWIGALEHDLDHVRVRVDEALQLAHTSGFRLYTAWLRAFEGWMIATSGNGVAGVDTMVPAIERAVALGTLIVVPFLYALLADAQLQAGLASNAIATADAGLLTTRSGSVCYVAELHRLRGEALLACSPERLDEAEHALRGAYEIAAGQGAEALMARAAASLHRHGMPVERSG